MSIGNYRIEVTNSLDQQGLVNRAIDGFFDAFGEAGIGEFIEKIPKCPEGFRRVHSSYTRHAFSHRVEFMIRETEIAA